MTFSLFVILLCEGQKNNIRLVLAVGIRSFPLDSAVFLHAAKIRKSQNKLTAGVATGAAGMMFVLSITEGYKLTCD